MHRCGPFVHGWLLWRHVLPHETASGKRRHVCLVYVLLQKSEGREGATTVWEDAQLRHKQAITVCSRLFLVFLTRALCGTMLVDDLQVS